MSQAASTLRNLSVDQALQSLLEMTTLAETSVRQALFALREMKAGHASQVFLREARLNEMEVEIHEQVVRLLAAGLRSEDDLRLLIASLRVTTDLERLGDLALNIAGRVVSLEKPIRVPRDLHRMAEAVETMVCDSLRAMQSGRLELAQQVLESDDRIDAAADKLSQRLIQEIEADPSSVAGGVQLLLSTRSLERMADHATNIAEDVIFWLRGLDVRHHLQGALPEPGSFNRMFTGSSS
jgi:phosphate transport system protein